MCHGNWVYPTSTIYQQQALAAAATDQPSSFPFMPSDYGYLWQWKLCWIVRWCKSTKVVNKSLPIKWSLTLQDGIAAAQVMFIGRCRVNTQSTDSNPRASLKDSPKGGWLPLPMNWRTKRITQSNRQRCGVCQRTLQAYGYAKRLNKVDESCWGRCHVLPPARLTIHWQNQCQKHRYQYRHGSRGEAYIMPR